MQMEERKVEIKKLVVPMTLEELKFIREVVADNYPGGPPTFPFKDAKSLIGHHLKIIVDDNELIDGEMVMDE
jgi:hypothetical protein